MAYFDTTHPVRQPKVPLWRAALLEAAVRKAEGSGRPELLREIDRHTHQVQQMLAAGLLAAGTILAVAGVMLIRM